MNSTLNSTKHKLALFFSLFSGALLIGISLLTIVLLRLEINRQARLTLETAMRSVIADYQSDNLRSVTSNFQLDTIELRPRSGTLNSAPAAERYELPKVSDKKVISDDTSLAQGTIINDSDPTFNTLQKNRQVYSRVIRANGDILFTSDLFDAFNVDPTQRGFKTYETDSICIHALTSEVMNSSSKGTVVQVGQYCPFPSSQQSSLFLRILGITCALLILTYGLGLLGARYFLRPLEKSIRLTREFAENCYHELMTPLSVALSTVAVSKRTKKYQQGLESVEEDLQNAYYSLQTLNKNIALDQLTLTQDSIKIGEVLLRTAAQFQDSLDKKKIHLNVSQVDTSVSLKGDPSSLKIIFENIFSNLVKYAPAKTSALITLNNIGVVFENELERGESIDLKKLFTRGYRGSHSQDHQGNGFGLAIVKDLVEAQGWRIKAQIGASSSSATGIFRLEVLFSSR